VRLAPTLRPCLDEDISAQRLEGVPHQRPFDRSKLAADGDGAFEGRPKPEMTARTKPGFTSRSLLFGSLGGDHGLATFAEILQEIAAGGLEQLRRGMRIGFEGWEEH
jgi:hypothetical protein